MILLTAQLRVTVLCVKCNNVTITIELNILYKNVRVGQGGDVIIVVIFAEI